MRLNALARRPLAVIAVLSAALLFSPLSRAQSTRTDTPAPMSAGVNRGTLDSFVGDHYWTCWVNPGSFQIRFTPGGAQEGFNLGKTEFAIALKPPTPSAKLSRRELPGGAVVYTGTTPKRVQVMIGMSPPNSKLVRQTVSYTLEATGSVDFSGAPSAGSAPSVAGVYNVMMNDHGTAKLLPSGDILTTRGEHGHWELFDAGSRTYVITIGRDRWDAVFQPGRGFVQTNGNLLLQLPPR